VLFGFAREAFFAVTSFKFTNADGVSRHGRFRIRPEAGTEYLSNEEAAAKSANFLFDEIGERLAKEPIKLSVLVQMAEPGDDVADASVPWPDSRTEIPLGTITMTARVDDQVPDRSRPARHRQLERRNAADEFSRVTRKWTMSDPSRMTSSEGLMRCSAVCCARFIPPQTPLIVSMATQI
jgi:hypothetical protein